MISLFCVHNYEKESESCFQTMLMVHWNNENKNLNSCLLWVDLSMTFYTSVPLEKQKHNRNHYGMRQQNTKENPKTHTEICWKSQIWLI